MTFMIVLVTLTMCEYKAESSKIIPVALFEKKHFFCKMQVVVTFCHFCSGFLTVLLITFERIELQTCAWSHLKALDS